MGDINNPDYPFNILRRHLVVSDRAYTMEQLVERSLRSTKKTIQTESGELRFTVVSSTEFSAYNEWYVSWGESCRGQNFGQNCQPVKGRIVRPNIECTNGYIHIVDTVMLDDSPPWLTFGDSAVGEASHRSRLDLLTLFVLTGT